MDLELLEAFSLKDKRSVIKSNLEKARHHFNVSAAEVGKQDSINSAELAFSIVSNSKLIASQILDKVYMMLDRDPRLELVQIELDFR